MRDYVKGADLMMLLVAQQVQELQKTTTRLERICAGANVLQAMAPAAAQAPRF
jgi:chlorite dismutase